MNGLQTIHTSLSSELEEELGVWASIELVDFEIFRGCEKTSNSTLLIVLVGSILETWHALFFTFSLTLMILLAGPI